MSRISQDTIDRIRDSTDIFDVISEYVELRRRGKNFFGLCPFHAEKTPSFSVAPDKQIYHCFGCGRGGNVITFIMEYEKVEFVEAIQKLGKRVGILVEFSEDDKKKEFFTQLYDLHTIAVKLYKENLQSKTGEKVRNYLKKRGVSEDTIKQFHIGFATPSWDQLFTTIASKNVPNDIVEKSGLFSKSDKGVFDRFRDRIMFPISNRFGRVVAFGGRDFSGTSDAKYLNSPETPIYNKSEILYGLSVTKDAIRQLAEKSLVVVEGYMDLLQLYQNGILNIVATSGTALTEKHVNEIRKYTNNVYLAYDGDTPGRKAAIRAGYNLLKGGLTPEIIEVPDGLDPDSWIKAKGVKEFVKAKNNSIGLINFHIKSTEFDLSKPANRSQLAKEIIDEIIYIKDKIIQRYTIKQIAELLSVDEDALMEMLTKKSRWIKRRKGDDIQTVDDATLNTSFEKAQRELIRLIINDDSDTVSLIKKYVNPDYFTHPVMKTVFTHLLQNNGNNQNLSGVLDQFEKNSEREFAAQILFETTTQRNPKQVAVDCIITLEQTPLKQRIAEQRIFLRETEKKGEDISSALSEIVRLQKELKALDQKRVQMINLG